MWALLPAAFLYSLLGVWLLNTFPKTFTMGEAMIVAQGLTLLIMDASIQILTLVGTIVIHVIYMYMHPTPGLSGSVCAFSHNVF